MLLRFGTVPCKIRFAPFKATLDNSMRTVMTSFNTINSIPTSLDKISFKEILKVKKGFFGFIISDWTLIGEMNPFIITVNPTSRFDM